MNIPRVIGRYEVVELIGRGGMGTVVRARDPRIGREVAIKLLREGFDTPDLRDRFSREARSAGRLSHPNIVTVYDIGEHEGLPFIAMEYVSGVTFAELVCGASPVPVSRALLLIEGVCAGLAHAHRAGIVHRDIKPANLIVGANETPKILDFGIAKLSASGYTLPGSILGTLNYMAPEQIKGASIDARADIFAIGAVLYELLAQRQAFPGDRFQEVVRHILSEEPPSLTQDRSDISPRLVAIIARALAKTPEGRFQTADALQLELMNFRLSGLAAAYSPASSEAPTRVGGENVGPRRPPDRDLAKLRAERIDMYLSAAARAFEAGNYETAIESCEQALILDPNDRNAGEWLDRVRAALDERHVQEFLAEARRELSRSSIATALEAVTAAALISPDHQAIAQVRAEIEEAQVRQRMRDLQAALERAEAAYGRGDFAAALSALDEAAAIDADHPDAVALRTTVEQAIAARQEEERIRGVVVEARRIFEAGNETEALSMLEGLPSDNQLAATTLDQLRLAFERLQEQRRLERERIERQERAAAMSAVVRTALLSGQLDDAEKALTALRDIDAEAPDLVDLTALVRDAQAAARLEAELSQTLADFEVRLAAGDLPAAGELMQAAVALAADDVRVPPARERFDRAMAAHLALELAKQRQREAEQRLEEATALLRDGELTSAAQVLALAAQYLGDDPRVDRLGRAIQDAVDAREAAAAAERLRRQVENLTSRASGRLQSGTTDVRQLTAALHDVEQALTLAPEDGPAQEVKAAVEQAIAASREATKVRAAVSNARRRFAAGKHRAALRLLQDFQPSSHPQIVEALNELQRTFDAIEEQKRLEAVRAEQERRAAALVAEAQMSLRDQLFGEALEKLSQAQELDPNAPGLSATLQETRRAQAAAAAAERLEAELSAGLGQLEEHLAKEDLASAGNLLRMVTGLMPNDSRVLDARRRVEAAIAERAARVAAEARERDAEQKTEEATRLVEQGELQSAGRVLEQALALNAENTRAAALAEEVREALKIRTAAEESERRRQQEERELLVREADGHFRAGELASAREKLEIVLGLEPSHPKARELKGTVERAERDARKAAAEHRRLVDKGIARAAKHISRSNFDEAVRELEAVVKIAPGDQAAVERLEFARREAAARSTPAQPPLMDLDLIPADTAPVPPRPPAPEPIGRQILARLHGWPIRVILILGLLVEGILFINSCNNRVSKGGASGSRTPSEAAPQGPSPATFSG